MHEALRSLVVTLLTYEARLVLMRCQPRIVAITGSVGKTTTKDAIYAAISGSVSARKSVKSFNSEIGVPLTILGLPNAASNPLMWIINLLRGAYRVLMPGTYPEWLVLEIGADRPGDVRSIASWIRPDVAVITGVPSVPVHVENFKSPEELVREKSSLAEYLKPGGKLIVNGDDPLMRELAAEYRGVSVRYGFESGNEYFASHDLIIYEGQKPAGIQFRVNRVSREGEGSGCSLPVVVLGSLGYPRMYAATAAIATAAAIGIDEVAAVKNLASWEPPAGRVRILAGLKGAVIIDDTYNSSPAAVLSALDTLINVQAKRRLVVLGDMLELGRYSAEAHRMIGKRVAECATALVTIGFRARAIAEAAIDAGMKEKNIKQYEMHEAARAGKELESELQEGDLVLVKGSQALRMERTVLEIMAEPSRASELLVRMDPEWMDR